MRLTRTPQLRTQERTGRLAPARIVLAVVLIAGPVLAACDSLDSLELFDTKKKLAGERRPVFPEGVPGVVSGVPPELVRGYREPEAGTEMDPARAAAQAAAATPVVAEKPPPRPPRPRVASRPKPPPTSDQGEVQLRGTTGAVPAASSQTATAPWPAAPPPPPQQQQQAPPWPGGR